VTSAHHVAIRNCSFVTGSLNLCLGFRFSGHLISPKKYPTKRPRVWPAARTAETSENSRVPDPQKKIINKSRLAKMRLVGVIQKQLKPYVGVSNVLGGPVAYTYTL